MLRNVLVKYYVPNIFVLRTDIYHQRSIINSFSKGFKVFLYINLLI